jgi:hypothetical protein
MSTSFLKIFKLFSGAVDRGEKTRKEKNRPVLSLYTNRITQYTNRTTKQQPKSLKPRNGSEAVAGGK